MTDERPVRACAVQEHVFEKPHLWTLWETDPQFQAPLLQWVEASQALDRLCLQKSDAPYEYINNFDLPYWHTLVWQDFPNMAAVEVANTALHGKHWLREVEWDLEHPNQDPPIATMHQRLQEQRETWGSVMLQNIQAQIDRRTKQGP